MRPGLRLPVVQPAHSRFSVGISVPAFQARNGGVWNPAGTARFLSSHTFSATIKKFHQCQPIVSLNTSRVRVAKPNACQKSGGPSPSELNWPSAMTSWRQSSRLNCHASHFPDFCGEGLRPRLQTSRKLVFRPIFLAFPAAETDNQQYVSQNPVGHHLSYDVVTPRSRLHLDNVCVLRTQ